MLLPPNYIETERLFLREPELTDADYMFNNYCQDIENIRYVVFTPHTSIDITIGFLKIVKQEWKENKNATYCICLKESRQMIGTINIRPSDHGADFGYVISKKYWNNGYTAEALKVLVDWSMQQPNIFRISAVCDAENYRSARVMEKAGLEKEGKLRRWMIFPNISNEPRDVYMLSKVK